jgi:hypothetical protein
MLTLLFALGILLFIVVTWNVQPFIRFVELVAVRINFDRFVSMLLNIWVLGWFLRIILPFIYSFIGLVLYLIFQLIEVSPILYRKDPERLKSLLQDRQYQADSSEIYKLKAEASNSPLLTYRWLTRASHVVYCIELVICLITFPPSDPFWAFPFYLATLQFNRIDWFNVILTLSVLFAAQMIVKGLLHIFPEVFPEAWPKRS